MVSAGNFRIWYWFRPRLSCENLAKAKPDKGSARCIPRGNAGFCSLAERARFDSSAAGLKFLTTQATLLKCEEAVPRGTQNGGTQNTQVTLFMKNVYEVLRQKEIELTRLEKEVEALRLVAPLLSEEQKEAMAEMAKPALATAVNGPQQPIRIPAPQVAVTPQPARAAGWEETAKRWP